VLMVVEERKCSRGEFQQRMVATGLGQYGYHQSRLSSESATGGARVRFVQAVRRCLMCVNAGSLWWTGARCGGQKQLFDVAGRNLGRRDEGWRASRPSVPMRLASSHFVPSQSHSHMPSHMYPITGNRYQHMSCYLFNDTPAHHVAASMPDSTPSQTVGSSSSTQTYREPPPLDLDLYGCIND
jgi:hypothetical protein